MSRLIAPEPRHSSSADYHSYHALYDQYQDAINDRPLRESLACQLSIHPYVHAMAGRTVVIARYNDGESYEDVTRVNRFLLPPTGDVKVISADPPPAGQPTYNASTGILYDGVAKRLVTSKPESPRKTEYWIFYDPSVTATYYGELMRGAV